MKQSNYDKVRALTGWHQFMSVMVDNECKKMQSAVDTSKGYMTHKELREICEHTDKLKFLSEQYIDAEMDLIGAAIRYNVPHTRLLEQGKAFQFYKMLEEKAMLIDNGEVVSISKS